MAGRLAGFVRLPFQLADSFVAMALNAYQTFPQIKGLNHENDAHYNARSCRRSCV